MTRHYFLEHGVWLMYDVPWQRGERLGSGDRKTRVEWHWLSFPGQLDLVLLEIELWRLKPQLPYPYLCRDHPGGQRERQDGGVEMGLGASAPSHYQFPGGMR